MPDREKVIKGIECCEIKGDCTGCPYDVEQGLPACKQLAIDALELLKEDGKRMILINNQCSLLMFENIIDLSKGW